MRTKRTLELIGVEGKRYESQNSCFVFAWDNLGSGLKAAGREGHGTESQLPVRYAHRLDNRILAKSALSADALS